MMRYNTPMYDTLETAGGVERRLPVFVYGTLRIGQPNYHRLLLASPDHRTAPGHVDGWELRGADAGFPWAVPAAGGRIVGDLITVAADAYHTVLARLDQLEGCNPHHPGGGNLYDRIAVDVTTAAGVAPAWMYAAGALLRHRAATRVPDGDWVAHRDARKEDRCLATR